MVASPRIETRTPAPINVATAVAVRTLSRAQELEGWVFDATRPVRTHELQLLIATDDVPTLSRDDISDDVDAMTVKEAEQTLNASTTTRIWNALPSDERAMIASVFEALHVRSPIKSPPATAQPTTAIQSPMSEHASPSTLPPVAAVPPPVEEETPNEITKRCATVASLKCFVSFNPTYLPS